MNEYNGLIMRSSNMFGMHSDCRYDHNRMHFDVDIYFLCTLRTRPSDARDPMALCEGAVFEQHGLRLVFLVQLSKAVLNSQHLWQCETSHGVTTLNF